MSWLSWWCLELSGNTQYAGVPWVQSGLASDYQQPHTTGITTATTMAAIGGNGPLALHLRSCTPRWCIEWMGNNPKSKWIYLLGVLRMCIALKVLVCSGNDALQQHWSVLRAIHILNTPKNKINCSWGCHLSIQHVRAERKALCGALGGHFCRRQPWSAMVVLVVGCCWPLDANVRSNYSRNS